MPYFKKLVLFTFFRFNLIPSLPSAPQCEYSRMLELIRKQTMAALMYSSNMETSSNSTTPTAIHKYEKQACGYEIVKLSQI